MLPTKFQFIWESGFGGEDFLEINQSRINQEKKNNLNRQHIASQWCLQLIFRMHNSDPTSQGVENRNMLLSCNAY
jgi:hypothetical protein